MNTDQDNAGEESWKSFFANNKIFVVINVGCIIMMFAQYIMQAYLLQIIQPLGGGSTQMGKILSISGILKLPAMFAFDALCKKIRNNALLKISMFGMLCKALLTFTAPNVGMVYVSHTFQLIGEVFGTGVIGGLLAYPVAIAFMGVSAASVGFYAYIVPFLISTVVGSIIADAIIFALQKNRALSFMQEKLN